jgi:8-oxo-dGTP diphosphatase
MAEKGKYVYEWPRPMVTVDAVVFGLFGAKVQILLINRANEPFKGRWAVPGGFVDIDEELEDAAARELFEETGVAGVPLEQMHTFGGIGRDPRGRQITVVYLGVVTDSETKVRAGDDAARVKWFDIEELPKELAFDHAEVIGFALGRLRGKRIYRDYRRGGG